MTKVDIVAMARLIKNFIHTVKSLSEDKSELLCHPTLEGAIFFPLEEDNRSIHMHAAIGLFGAYGSGNWHPCATENIDDIRAHILAGGTYYIADLMQTYYIAVNCDNMHDGLACLLLKIPVGILPDKYAKFWRRGSCKDLRTIYIQDTLF